MKDNWKKLLNRFESEHIGKTFDEGYEKLRKRIGRIIDGWTGGSEKFASGFLNEYGEKHKGSLLGKILGIKKREHDEDSEEHMSDFDF